MTTDAQPALELDLPAVPDSAAAVRHAVAERLERTGVDLSAVRIAVNEAVCNAILHASGDGRPVRLKVLVYVDDTGATVVVADDGTGLAPRPDSPGFGIGLPLIAALADSVEFDQTTVGTRVTVRFNKVAEAA